MVSCFFTAVLRYWFTSSSVKEIARGCGDCSASIMSLEISRCIGSLFTSGTVSGSRATRIKAAASAEEPATFSSAGFRPRFFGLRSLALGGGIALRSRFVAFTAVVGNVKARTLENEAGATPDQAFDPAFAPCFSLAEVLRTDLDRGVFHRLHK